MNTKELLEFINAVDVQREDHTVLVSAKIYVNSGSSFVCEQCSKACQSKQGKSNEPLFECKRS